MKHGVACLQPPVKYPQIPANLIGYIGILIWRIQVHVCGRLYLMSL